MQILRRDLNIKIEVEILFSLKLTKQNINGLNFIKLSLTEVGIQDYLENLYLKHRQILDF